MYRRVLVPLDGSRLAEAVLPFIEGIAGPLDMEIVLIRVASLTREEVERKIDLLTSMGPDRPMPSELEARAYLDPLVERLETKGLRASARVSAGEPASEIVTAARRVGADLIAMTTHGRSGLGRLVFGSIAESVLRASPVPVFLLKMTEEALAATGPAGSARMTVDRILFPTDFSEAALAAWPTARSIAAAFEAELILQHVIPTFTASTDFPIPRYLEQEQADAERELARLGAEAPGLKSRIRVGEGRAADQILRAAVEERADLIVMGTTGRSGVGRVLLGSVAAEVVRLAACPVIGVGPVSQRGSESHVA